MDDHKFEITDRVRLILKGCPVPIEDLPISFVERRVKEYNEWLARGLRERDAMDIHLVECSDMPGIYRDKDRKYPFFGDCQNCHRFAASSALFAPGGKCTLHHVSVGPGYICPDSDFYENIGWPEFDRIKGGKNL